MFTPIYADTPCSDRRGPSAQGDSFERLIAACLRRDVSRSDRFSNVWLWQRGGGMAGSSVVTQAGRVPAQDEPLHLDAAAGMSSLTEATG
jgi:hypothetical protein